MARNYEDGLSFATAEYLDTTGLLYTHFPAGEYRPAITGAKLRRMGLKRGVPDYILFGLMMAIELKSKSGRLTKHQKRWRDALVCAGWSHCVCRTIDDVIEAVGQRIKKRGPWRKNDERA